MSRVFTPDPDTTHSLKVTVTVTKLCVIKLESFCFLICKNSLRMMGKLSLMQLFYKFYDGCKPGKINERIECIAYFLGAIAATRGRWFSRALVIEALMTCNEYHCNNIVNPDHKAIKFSARPRHKSLKCSISCLLRAKNVRDTRRRRKLRLWVTLAASSASGELEMNEDRNVTLGDNRCKTHQPPGSRARSSSLLIRHKLNITSGIRNLEQSEASLNNVELLNSIKLGPQINICPHWLS